MVEPYRQLEEALSWRLITELWRRFPDRFSLIETHPCSGQYDCLSLRESGDDLPSVLDVNRGGGSVHVHRGRTPRSCSDWLERMLADPLGFLDEIGDAIGIAAPKSLPKSTRTTISFRYVCELLTHSVGRLEKWECRNGFYDTSGYGGGKREALFNSFPGIGGDQTLNEVAKGKLSRAYGYWFLLRDSEPKLCVDTGGRLYKRDGNVHDLTAIYAKHKRVWPVIAETAMELLP